MKPVICSISSASSQVPCSLQTSRITPDDLRKFLRSIWTPQLGQRRYSTRCAAGLAPFTRGGASTAASGPFRWRARAARATRRSKWSPVTQSPPQPVHSLTGMPATDWAGISDSQQGQATSNPSARTGSGRNATPQAVQKRASFRLRAQHSGQISERLRGSPSRAMAAPQNSQLRAFSATAAPQAAQRRISASTATSSWFASFSPQRQAIVSAATSLTSYWVWQVWQAISCTQASSGLRKGDLTLRTRGRWRRIPPVKTCSAQQAAALVRPVDTLAVPLGPGLPTAFLDALGERDDWRELTVFAALLTHPHALFTRRGVRLLSGFFGPIERALSKEIGRAHV